MACAAAVEALRARVLDDAQVAHGPGRRPVSAPPRWRPSSCPAGGVRGSPAAALAAEKALVELDDAAQQELALAARHGVGDLAPHEPGRLGRHAELAGELGRRGRLLGRGQQPDRQKPLAQVGARAGKIVPAVSEPW